MVFGRGIWAALVAAVALVALPAAAPAAVVADSGFRSDTDGYAFRNYGPVTSAGQPATNLTAESMQKLFGRRVCSGAPGPNCMLAPEAQLMLDAINPSMAGGHCFGMATTAQLFYEGKGKPPTPSKFGSSTVPGLGLVGNPSLQAHIAYAWTLQLLPSVADQTPRSPRGVIRELKRTLEAGKTPNVLVLRGLNNGQADGHAITPIAVEDLGGGQSRIAVYDNNWPGQTRYVHVNTAKNTWSYQLGPNVTWPGGLTDKAYGGRTLALADPSPGLGHQPCFVCPPQGKPRRGKDVRLLVAPEGGGGRHGSVEVRDERGRTTGCGPGGCSNEIRGAKLRLPATGAPPWRTTAPPLIELPTIHDYRIRLGPTSKGGRVREDVHLVGRGFSLGAAGVRIGRKDRDVIRIRRKLRRISFQNDAHGVEAPRIQLSSSDRTGPDYEFGISPAGINPNARITVDFNPLKQRLRLLNRGGARIERVVIKSTTLPKDESSRKKVGLKRDKPLVLRYG